MINNPDLYDLYKVTTNTDGSITISNEERLRFEQNFQDFLILCKVGKYNNFVEEHMNQLIAYSKWFDRL